METLPPEFVRLHAARMLGMDVDDERLDSEYYLSLAWGYLHAINETKANFQMRGLELQGFDL